MTERRSSLQPALKIHAYASYISILTKKLSQSQSSLKFCSGSYAASGSHRLPSILLYPLYLPLQRIPEFREMFITVSLIQTSLDIQRLWPPWHPAPMSRIPEPLNINAFTGKFYYAFHCRLLFWFLFLSQAKHNHFRSRFFKFQLRVAFLQCALLTRK